MNAGGNYNRPKVDYAALVKSSYMLENLAYPGLLWYNAYIEYHNVLCIMPSKKIPGADNQQERLKMSLWIVGFVDGEGSFLVSIFRNKTTRLGWQVFPEFVITQGAKSRKSLEQIKKFFSCGEIFINRRHDNHHEDTYRFCVRSIKDLRNKIVPFFEKYPLRTMKLIDFKKFKRVLRLMENGVHLKESGLESIRKIVSTMNRKGMTSLKSSETIR
jgi:hypothetical protein